MSTWAKPEASSLRTAVVLLIALGVPGAIAGAVGGTSAGMAVGLAGGAAMAFGSVSNRTWTAGLILLIGGAAAAGVLVAEQPLPAALLVLVTTLLVAPANQWSVGMLALVPVMAVVFASADRELPWWQAGLWTMVGAVIGALVVSLAMKEPVPRSPQPRGHAWRHAAVLAVVSAATFGVALATEVPHAYWVTLTLLVALRPLPAERAEILRDRLWGTLLGAGLALAAVAALGPTGQMIAASIALVLLAAYAISKNYFMQTLFLTPMLLLFASAGDGDTALAYTAQRVVFTVVGVLIGAALVALLAWWDADDDAPAPTPAGSAGVTDPAGMP